jgi:hypothetical protein|tara:strand:- start:34 stop:570 length:537 start_codon:yes stop_codon:yes gene_type:complete
MKIKDRKIVAGLAIYEITLITFVLVFKPYGRSMSSSDWDSFWVWALVVPLAAFLIYFLLNWSLGNKTNIIKIKKSDLKFNFSFKNIFSRFYHGKLSLPLSFFVFGFIGTALAALIGLLIFKNMGIARLVALPWNIYALIGIWSSADNYKGLKVWAILAKVLAVLWLINNLGKLLLGVY